MLASHCAACEEARDRVAVDVKGAVPLCESLLASLAVRLSSLNVRIGLAIARRDDVRRGIESLVRIPPAPYLGGRALGLGLCALLGMGWIGLGSFVAQPITAQAADDAEKKPDTVAKEAVTTEKPTPAEESARSRPQSLKFKVLQRDDNLPVADAKVDVHMYGDGNINRYLSTNEHGEVIFEYPDGEKPVSLWAMIHHPGLVPYYVNFGRGLIPATLPTEKNIRMDRGKKIGGRVVDAEGKPVAGAQLSITTPATDTPSEIHYHLLYEQTAEDGSWSLDGAPLKVGGLNIQIDHPRFIKASQSVQDREDGRYQLDPGLTLSGRVIDQQGNPIPQAHITIGKDRWGRIDRPVAVNKDGSYTVYALTAQSTSVTAEAAGFAPQVKSATIERDAKPLDFQLAVGRVTRFRVVNTEGEPVAGVRIVADTWKEFRTLWWQTQTDADGEAVWNGAPEEPVEYHILRDGYASLRDAVVAPQEEPHVIELHKPLRVEGIVTDAMKQKIGEFCVSLGRKFSGNDDIHWIGHDGTMGRNGKFELSYTETCDEIYLRIEAKGFKPWVSEAIPFRKSLHKLHIRLK